MRSRISNYKKNIINYDVLTQFAVKHCQHIPNLLTSQIQIKTAMSNDAKQICIYTTAIQLIGNRHTICFTNQNSIDIRLKLRGNDNYLLLENLLLLSYKNKTKNVFGNQTGDPAKTIHIHFKDLITVMESLSLHSNFLKLLEKISSKNLDTSASYQLSSSKVQKLNYYFLRSLGYPF